jgi:hypothetical protein
MTLGSCSEQMGESSDRLRTEEMRKKEGMRLGMTPIKSHRDRKSHFFGCRRGMDGGGCRPMDGRLKMMELGG